MLDDENEYDSYFREPVALHDHDISGLPQRHRDYLKWAEKYFVVDFHGCECAADFFDKDSDCEAITLTPDGPESKTKGHRVEVQNFDIELKNAENLLRSVLLKSVLLNLDDARAASEKRRFYGRREDYFSFPTNMREITSEENLDLDLDFRYFVPPPKFFGVATASMVGAGLGIMCPHLACRIEKDDRRPLEF